MNRIVTLLGTASLFASVVGCAPPRAPGLDEPNALTGGLTRTFSLPGHEGRDYILHLPPSYEPATAVPVVLAFHSGGGNKESVNRTTCADGDETSPTCLFAGVPRATREP